MAGTRVASRAADAGRVGPGSRLSVAARGQLGEIQRARILTATFDVVSERGVGSVSVAHIVERSGVSRRTFYELFVDRDDCFHAAFEQTLAEASARVLSACSAERVWRERVRAGLLALLCFFDAEPRQARLLIGESVGAGPRTIARRGELVAKLTSIVEEGASESKASQALPPLTGEGIVGGALAVIQRRLAEGHTPLVELANPLMSMIVLPYLGTGVARRELQRAIPAAASEVTGRASAVGDPFKAAGMRLTYRTVRVLMAIAERPGASNRLAGDTAEIRDQGQVSKLLSRLQRAGMVTNSGLGPGQGAPNAWTLTPAGRRVTDSIRAHTDNDTDNDTGQQTQGEQ